MKKFASQLLSGLGHFVLAMVIGVVSAIAVGASYHYRNGVEAPEWMTFTVFFTIFIRYFPVNSD